ncbi:unnamed protein product, partial [Ectocarpus sp. 12 AP-2014]
MVSHQQESQEDGQVGLRGSKAVQPRLVVALPGQGREDVLVERRDRAVDLPAVQLRPAAAAGAGLRPAAAAAAPPTTAAKPADDASDAPPDVLPPAAALGRSPLQHQQPQPHPQREHVGPRRGVAPGVHGPARAVGPRLSLHLHRDDPRGLRCRRRRLGGRRLRSGLGQRPQQPRQR